MIDLDAIASLEKAAPSGKWEMRMFGGEVHIMNGDHSFVAQSVDMGSAALIVALRNAAPALIEELARLRAFVGRIASCDSETEAFACEAHALLHPNETKP